MNLAAVRRFWNNLDAMGKLSLAIIAAAYVAVLAVGLAGSGQPMVADEIVHYYMLVTQAGRLPAPNVDVEIPMEGWTYVRQYPHVFLWHYIGAVIWKLFGGTFASVQVYQSLFWLQLLLAVWFLIRHELPQRSDLWVVCMAVMASLPMCLLFSVLFFQGVPATAQVVTAFALLRRKRWLWSVLFMALALSIKVTVFVLLPVYFLGFVFVFWLTEAKWRTLVRGSIAVIMIAVSCVPMAVALKKTGFDYYPAATIVKYAKRFIVNRSQGEKVVQSMASLDEAGPIGQGDGGDISEEVASQELSGDITSQSVDTAASYQRPEICNHPGDLRLPVNWGIYFGGLFWVLAAAGVSGVCLKRIKPQSASRGWWWLPATGAWGAVVTAFHMHAAPDARFFLPCVPFIVAGCACAVSGFRSRKWTTAAILIAAILQSGMVLAKTHSLRSIPGGVSEAIAFMQKARIDPSSYMMYPEGHERFIPGSVVWYLDFRLRDFWRAGNDERLEILDGYKLGAIIVKKARIRDVGADTVDLGLYPASFVRDIEGDSRFRKVFDNDAVSVYLLPGAELKSEASGRDGVQ